MVIFNEEYIDEIVDEIKPIAEMHWQEIANNKDVRPLNIDWDKYIKMNRLGYLKVFTARENDQLIGYAAFAVSDHMHYSGWLYAVSDVYYIDPSHRKKGTGFDFFEYIFRTLKDKGVHQIAVQEKTKHAHKEFFEALGLTHTENIYEKVL